MYEALRDEDKVHIRAAARRTSDKYRMRRKKLRFGKMENKAIKQISYKSGSFGTGTKREPMHIFDIFKGQKTTTVSKLIEENNCAVVYVLANMTNYFQPLDLTVNGPAKQFLKTKFEEWYARQIEAQLNRGIDIYSVDVPRKLSIMKPVHAKWLIGLYDYLRNSRAMIMKGFDMAGINDALTGELEPEDPFKDLDE